MAGYFVLHTRWHTLDRLADYQAGARSSIADHGGKSLVYDVGPEVVEGTSELAATVILEFADLATAKAWYNSPGYQAVLPIRLESSDGIGRFVSTTRGRPSPAPPNSRQSRRDPDFFPPT